MPKRKRNNRKAPWFVQPVTGRRFRQERRAAEREEFRPLARQLAKERIASRRNQRDIGNYFADYQQRLANLQQGVQSAYGTANQQVANLMQQGSQADQARMDQIQQAAQQDAARRGVDVDPSVSQRAASAQAARTSLGTTFGGLLASMGANEAAYGADKQRIGARESIAARAREAARRRGIESDARELASKRADFRRDFRRRTREGEREFWLGRQELALSRQGLRNQLRVAQIGAQPTKHTNVNISRGGSKETDRYGSTDAGQLRAKARAHGSFDNFQVFRKWALDEGFNIGTIRKVWEESASKERQPRRGPWPTGW